MKERIKKITPVTYSKFEKENQEFYDKINKTNKELFEEIKKGIKNNKDVNIRMNQNTNSHLEEVKRQLDNSVTTKMEYNKQRILSLEQKTASLEQKLSRVEQRVVDVQQKTLNANKEMQEVYKLQRNIEKNIIQNNLLLTQKLDRIERLLTMSRYGITTEKREKKIVVSLTSYEKRINKVPLVLERILNQTVKPDYVILYLSIENFPKLESDLPERLLEMKQLGLEIRWCEGDIKSYKKIIPALKEFPEDIIITVDDDLYYDLDMIEKLYDSYKKFPNAISAIRVHRMQFDSNEKLKPYNSWDNEFSEVVGVPSMDLFPTTGAGVLIPPHSLHEEVFNEEQFCKLCPNADDVWVKFMAILNDTSIVLVAPFTKLNCLENTQEETLWKINREENDKQINQLLEHYHSYFEEKTLYDRIYNNRY